MYVLLNLLSLPLYICTTHPLGDNVLGMHIRSQNLNTTPEVGGQILGIFVSSVATNSPAALSGR